MHRNPIGICSARLAGRIEDNAGWSTMNQKWLNAMCCSRWTANKGKQSRLNFWCPTQSLFPRDHRVQLMNKFIRDVLPPAKFKPNKLFSFFKQSHFSTHHFTKYRTGRQPGSRSFITNSNSKIPFRRKPFAFTCFADLFIFIEKPFIRGLVMFIQRDYTTSTLDMRWCYLFECDANRRRPIADFHFASTFRFGDNGTGHPSNL